MFARVASSSTACSFLRHNDQDGFCWCLIAIIDLQRSGNLTTPLQPAKACEDEVASVISYDCLGLFDNGQHKSRTVNRLLVLVPHTNLAQAAPHVQEVMLVCIASLQEAHKTSVQDRLASLAYIWSMKWRRGNRWTVDLPGLKLICAGLRRPCFTDQCTKCCLRMMV